MFNGIDAVFVLNSRVHLVAQFIKENKLNDIKIIGYGLVQPNVDPLNEGKIYFFINQKLEKKGYLGIKKLYKTLALKQELDVHLSYVKLDIVVKENI
jgi:LacI family transcriptional regulator